MSLSELHLGNLPQSRAAQFGSDALRIDFLIFALVWRSSVMMPPWAPVRLMALCRRRWPWPARRSCSPVACQLTSGRDVSLAIANQWCPLGQRPLPLDVLHPLPETCATLLIRSTAPDVPPYFCTMIPMTTSSSASTSTSAYHILYRP